MSQIIKITSDFYWLGALDPTLRTFDIIMETAFGTTYNAYLLKTSAGSIVFETVKETFFNDYLSKLQKETALEDIKYIVINHTEPDHAGSVSKLLQLVPNATVVGTSIALKYVGQMINAPFKSLAVKDGDKLSLGNHTLRFISASQLHWPDTMYTYIENEKILVTCDSFGAHYCDERLLKSHLEAAKEEDFLSAYKYYFDMIMGPFKPYVQKALQKIKTLDIHFICPGHGMILSSDNMQKYIQLYDTWSKPVQHEPSIVIAFVSAYGYTKTLAETIAAELKTTDYKGHIHLCNLETESIASVMEKVNSAEGLLIGSPTILADALPPVWQLLISLNPVLHKHLHAGCFGSFGWSGEAIKHMEERLKQIKCTMPVAPLAVNFKPSPDDLMLAKTFAKNFAASFNSI